MKDNIWMTHFEELPTALENVVDALEGRRVNVPQEGHDHVRDVLVTWQMKDV